MSPNNNNNDGTITAAEQEVLELEIPLAIGICVIYILCALLMEHYRAHYNQAIYLHESSVVSVVGLAIGYFIHKILNLSISFNSNFFFYLVLPPVIFSAGYSLKRKKFFEYLHFIACFGFAGTLLNFVLIAYGAYYFGLLFPNSVTISWNQSLLLSSVLAGSDEVSALSLVNIDDFPRLGALIFGEGVVNDALSIVLFRTFLPLYNEERHHIRLDPLIQYSVSWSMVFSSICIQILGSITIGLSCGLVNAYLLKNLPFSKSYPIHQTALILLFAYLSYAIAEAFAISGILTIFITAVILAHYSWYSLSKSAQVATKMAFSATSDIAEGFAFSYVGMSLWSFAGKEVHYAFAVYMIIIVVTARLFTICSIFYIGKIFFKSYEVPITEQLGFVMGGIVRGCLCWAQVLQVKGNSLLITTTLIIVMTTSIGCGIVLPMILPLLMKSDKSNSPVTPTSSYVEISPANRLQGQNVLRVCGSFLFFYWIRFDEMVMKPLFGGSQTESRRLQLMNETSSLLYHSFTEVDKVAGYFYNSDNIGRNETKQRTDDDYLDEEADDGQQIILSLSNINSIRGNNN